KSSTNRPAPALSRQPGSRSRTTRSNPSSVLRRVSNTWANGRPDQENDRDRGSSEGSDYTLPEHTFDVNLSTCQPVNLSTCQPVNPSSTGDSRSGHDWI